MYLRGFSHPSDHQVAKPMWTTSPHMALQITDYPSMVAAYINCLATVHRVVAYALPAWRETSRKT